MVADNIFQKNTFPARGIRVDSSLLKTVYLQYICLLIFRSVLLHCHFCCTAVCRQMQKQTDELRQKLQQREDELATSQSNAQVCCTPVLTNESCCACEGVLYTCIE